MVKVEKTKLTKKEKEQLASIAKEVYRNYAPMAKMLKNTSDKLQKSLSQPIAQVSDSITRLSPTPEMLASMEQLAAEQQKFIDKVATLTSLDVSKIIPKSLPSMTEELSSFSTIHSRVPVPNSQKPHTPTQKEPTEKQELSPTPYKYHYYQEIGAFILDKRILCPINFTVRSGENNIKVLFECFYEILEEKGVDEGNYKVVLAKPGELIKKAREKGIKHADRKWLKATKYNLIQKIPDFLEEDVVISNYDRELGGYHFKIKTNKKLAN